MSKTSIYKLEGRVPLREAAPLGIQHVLAMFLGNVSPLIIICGMLNMDIATKSLLIQNAMFIAGIATLIQLYPLFNKIGSGLPIVMGTSSGFIGTAKAIGAQYGYGAIMGASIVGSLLEIVLGFFIKPLRKLFPPVVTSLVVISIGLSLLPIGVKYFAGGAGTKDFGSLQNLFIATVVLVIIIVLGQYTTGFTRVASILIGISVGYVISILMGIVDFTQVQTASWISLPQLFLKDIVFKWDAILPMCIMFVATAVETIGDTSGITVGGLGREATDAELSGAVVADGVGSLVAALFGVLPNTSFSQNVGLVAITKVVNRFAIATGAIFLVAAGFVPKLSALLSIMPQSVLGGAAIYMFAMIIVSGLQSLGREDLSGRNGVIVALALGLGMGLSNVPEALAQLPSFVSTIFTQNGIVMTFVMATILNLVLPKDKTKAK